MQSHHLTNLIALLISNRVALSLLFDFLVFFGHHGSITVTKIYGSTQTQQVR